MIFSAAGCSRQGAPQAAAAPPAIVAKPADEKDLNTVRLTPQAETRLGIRTVAVDEKEVEQHVTLGGETLYPPGQSTVVSAPVTGTLAASGDRAAPLPGTVVARGQAVLVLLPLLSPERSVLTPAERVRLAEARSALASSQIEAQRQTSAAEVELAAAQTRLGRAEQLVKDGAGSQQAVDDARTQVALAQRALEAARARQDLLARSTLDAEAGRLVAQPIESPLDGVIVSLRAVPGQTVVAASPLFEVARRDRLWIRVPVYAGQWRNVAGDREAIVEELGAGPSERPRTARPVAAPPTANPQAATLDLYYEVDNADGRLRSGQKVSVIVPLDRRRRSLVVPWSAVLYDIHGGTWVYEQAAAQTFVRRRVEVERVLGEQAVLARGPIRGTAVVAEGAAELFGTEFGYGK